MTIAYEKIKAKDYDEWEWRDCNCERGDCPCVICGRTVKNAKKEKKVKWIRLYGGGEFLTDSDESGLEDDMGWFPVGATCYKKFLKMAAN